METKPWAPTWKGIQAIGPLHDPITWHGINYAGTQVTQWDFQNKGTGTSPAQLSFVLNVPLCNLCPSIINSIPCDRIVQRAYCHTESTVGRGGKEGGMLEDVLPCKLQNNAHCKRYGCEGCQHVSVQEHMKSWYIHIQYQKHCWIPQECRRPSLLTPFNCI